VWIIATWQRISPEMIVRGPMQWMGLMIMCYGMAVKRMGMLGVSVRKMKALTVKIGQSETDW